MTYDVFVAGLGVMGSAVARALARGGLRVAGCDGLEPPHALGSSHGESRIIRAAYFEDPVYAPLARRALGQWRELEAETGRALLRITGGLNIGPVEGMLVSGALASARSHDIEHALLDQQEAGMRFPGVRVPTGEVALFEPDAGILDPENCVAALLESARAAGAELLTNQPLMRWERSGDSFTIVAGAHRYHARHLVLALGAWLPRFRPELELIVHRQPVFWFDTLEPVLYSPERLPHYLIEFEPDRVFYGFPDLGRGLKCAIHHEGTATDPHEVDRSTRPHELDEVQGLVRRYLPGAAGPLLRAGVCLYTNTRDGHFVIDRADEYGLWRMSACSGHGFKFAPALAELLADAIALNTELPAVFAGRRFTH